MRDPANEGKSFYQTSVPFRMDRLPWSRFHTMVVIALGITWILDGLEVTLKGAISGVLENPQTLGLSPEEIGLIASFYLIGAVFGALFFGYLTDKWGRKKLFSLTLFVYLVGVLLTAFSWNVWSFAIFRLLTGAGIGGEYAAINSAIDELIPARVRGRVDLIINGTYWLGAALGSFSTLFLLDPHYFHVNVGWRLGFGIGSVLGLIILVIRKHIPESPRWLVIHGRLEEAEATVDAIEAEVEQETGIELERVEKTVKVYPGKKIGLKRIAQVMFSKYRRSSILCLSLMISQAFLYNAIFFTYVLVLTTFYHIPAENTGLYLLPFALGNFLGPLALGHLFDSVGRRKMISISYALSAGLLLVTGYLFSIGVLSATSQTALWSIIFFFASAAASSAYLTVSEIFPLEVRGLAIALFFAIGTGVGGVMAPWLFGALIGTGSRIAIFYGYIIAALLMVGAALVEVFYGIDAERKSLEDIASPLSHEAEV